MMAASNGSNNGADQMEAEPAEEEGEERITYNALFATIPIRAMNLSCRRKLAMALNPSMPLPSMLGYSRDWQGLAEVIGYNYEMNKLLGNRDDPTMALLEIWEKKGTNPTMADLLEYLQMIERYDVIIDIKPMLERDAQQYLLSEEEDKRTREKPIQVPIVTSEKQTRSAFTVQEVPEICWEEDDEYLYDAYVSYVDSDIEFVNQLIEKMEGERNLRLFVKDRDMLAGFDEASADVSIIHEKCKRILLIISPEFLSDPKCQFTILFVQALGVDNNLYARKVIPVISKPCELPVRLKYIARVDYTKKDLFGKFWDRLYHSIKNPMQGELPMSTTLSGSTLNRLSPNHTAGETHSDVSMTSDTGSTESLSGGATKPARTMSTNLVPTQLQPQPQCTTSSSSSSSGGEVAGGGCESRTTSSAHLTVGKTEKKKKSPLTKRKLFTVRWSRTNGQTQ